MQNKELLKLFYKTIKLENEESDVFIEENSFNSVKVRIKILEVGNDNEDFFEDFIITEEEMFNCGEIYYGFTCLINIKNQLYIYEMDGNFEINIYKSLEGTQNSTNYASIEGDDENYSELCDKMDKFYEIINKKSKYKINFLMKTKDQKIDFIKI